MQRSGGAVSPLCALNQCDLCVVSGRGGEAPVARQKLRIQRLGQRDIDRVVRRQIMPQIPDPRQQEVVRVTPQREVGEIVECRPAARAVNLPARRLTAKYLGRFNIDQMGA